ncbi:hypothetical protein GWK41_06590 [Persephonella atlantica]|uniref:Uncharacterized protein n=1 Tax=Persephonella atlantica TaxID=2699429 RepID=A0ABS1GII2_9AQUI|nr:hypothetical protein [Persephonella atlantica]MBK3332732.1 hypothetical protein [Persephonella atlantica]
MKIRLTPKTVSIIFLILMVSSVGFYMVEKSIDFFNSEFAQNETDFRGYIIVLFARLFMIIGWLAIILGLFFRGHFKDVEKPKADLLELHEKIEKMEKKRFEKKGT